MNQLYCCPNCGSTNIIQLSGFNLNTGKSESLEYLCQEEFAVYPAFDTIEPGERVMYNEKVFTYIRAEFRRRELLVFVEEKDYPFRINEIWKWSKLRELEIQSDNFTKIAEKV